MAGRMERVRNARMRGQSEPYWPWNCMIPSGQVYLASEFKTISGNRKLFQLPTKLKTPTVAMMGRQSGSVTYQFPFVFEPQG